MVEEVREAKSSPYEKAKDKVKAAIAIENGKNYIKNLTEEIGIERR